MNRRDRRIVAQSQRKRARQESRRAELETELQMVRQRIATNGARVDANHAGAIADVETFVDSLARAYADGGERAITDHDDPALFEVIAGWNWRGATTAEEVKEVMTKEVARRSVGKKDIMLLLSSIDHTAVLLFETIPDRFEGLDGAALVEAANGQLTMEDFGRQLVEDPRWAEMRTRWVLLGWRGSIDEQTFNAAYIRAVCERLAEFKALGGGVFPDTVLDAHLARVMPDRRAAMERAFKERFEREYAALPKAGTHLVTIDGPEAQMVRTMAAQDGVSPDAFVQRIVDDARAKTLDEVGSAVKVGTDRALAERVSRVLAPYSDHELMRWGRIVWERTYATGMLDEAVRADMIATNRDSGFGDQLVLFSAKWAVHAFQRLQTSHTFAAALMCSDFPRETTEGIEKQWDAFMVIVPTGMLGVGDREFSRILVATYSFGAHMILLTASGAHLGGTVVDEAPTLQDLLVSEERELDESISAAGRCFVMAKRLVAGLLLNLQHPGTATIRTVAARAKSLRRQAEPEHRIVTIGKPLTIDCRPAVKEYLQRGHKGAGRKHGPPTVQVMVRGHSKMQVHGVGRALRKQVWIQPYWRGDEAALIQTRATKVN